MNAELLSVGTELLLGEILNTDAKFLSEELSCIGINTYYQTVVGDNKKRLKNALELALSRADLVIASGGLGPTPDDLTKEVIAEVMNEKLILSEDVLEEIKDYHQRTKRQMPESNVKQAMVPENGVVLHNKNGTAPGCIIEKWSKVVVMLPGPPNELVPMFKEQVVPFLINRNGKGMIYTKTLKLFGIGEAKVAEMLSDLIEKDNPTLASYAELAGVRLRLATFAHDKSEAKNILKDAQNEIFCRLGEYIYSDEDKTLPEVVTKKLMEKGLVISAAESCTGGMFAKMIVDVPGSSAVLNESIVTYSNEAKKKYLGVKEDTLENYGAVSPDVAIEMAQGIKRCSGADIGVGITGIAGPDGGTEKKPVGTVYVAVSYKEKNEVMALALSGTREKVRYSACMNAFNMILKKIKVY